MATAGRGGVQVKSIKDYIDEQHSNIPSFMRRKSSDEIERSDTEKAKNLRGFFSSTGGSRGRGANPITKPSVKSEAKPLVKSEDKPSVKVDTRDMDYGNRPNDVPDAVIKKTEIVKTAPVVSRKSTPSVLKPKASASGMGGIDRAALEEFRNSYDKEQRPQLDALREYTDNIKLRDAADTENARTKTEAVEASEYKKGGMTKRPPKPAKKVPPRKFASGGSVSRTSASKRGDGCATKGHTKGKYL